MIVLGIDPGTRKAGYGVVDLRGSRPHLVDAGTLRLGDSKVPIGRRLAALRAELRSLLIEHGPAAVVLEKAWLGKNPQSALRVGEARGVVFATAQENGTPVQDVAAPTVRAKLGLGRKAKKEEAGRAVSRLLGIAYDPTQPDALDALALALCWDPTTERLRSASPASSTARS